MARLLIFMFLLSGCATNSIGERQKQEATSQMAMQHTAVMVWSALYFCKLKQWPKNLDDLKTYGESNSLPLQVKINWPLLISQEENYRVGEAIVFETREGIIPHTVKVVSTNKKPACDLQNVKLDSHIQLGD